MASAQQPSGRIAFTEYDLANGLHVILHKDHSTPMVAIVVAYHVGSKNENPDRTGFAHLFEHLMFDGSANIKRGEFDKHIYGAGGDDNAYTTEDKTVYHEVLPSHQLELGLWLESDRMMQLSITDVSVNTQREVVKEERRYRVDNRPYGSWDEQIVMRAYRVHPYRWPVIGSMEHLNAASLADVQGFYKTFYAPNNAALVICGDIDDAQTKAAVEKYFGDIPRGANNIVRPTVVEPPQTQESRDVIYDNVALPAVFQAYHMPAAGMDDYYALYLLTDILATGESSRLYKKLVYTEQVASEVGSFVEGREQPGLFYITATANEGKSADAMETSLWEEIEKIKTEGVSERELQKVKNKAESDFVNRLQQNMRKADLLAHYYVFYKNANLINEEIHRFAKVTTDDIKRVARQYLTKENRVVLHYLPKAQ
jgi:predicted Zn-dependent peptidase